MEMEWHCWVKFGKSATASRSRHHFCSTCWQSDPLLHRAARFRLKNDKPNRLCNFNAVRYVNKALLFHICIITSNTRIEQRPRCDRRSGSRFCVCLWITTGTTVNTLKSNKSVLAAASSSSSSDAFSCDFSIYRCRGSAFGFVRYTI